MADATSQVVAGVASLAATIAQHRAAIALGPAEAAAARSLAHDLRSLAHDLLALAPERPAATPPAGAAQAAAAEPLTLLSCDDRGSNAGPSLTAALPARLELKVPCSIRGRSRLQVGNGMSAVEDR